MVSLWYALKNEMERMDIMIPDEGPMLIGYPRGLYRIQMENLVSPILADGPTTDLRFNLVLRDNKTDYVWETKKIQTAMYWRPADAHSAYERKTRTNILSKMECLGVRKSLDALAELVGMSMDVPDTPIELEALLTVIEKYEAYLEEMEEYREEYEDSEHRSVLTWFFSANYYTVDGEEFYLKDGVCEYNAILGIREWSEHGIGFMLGKVPEGKVYDDVIARLGSAYNEFSQEKKDALAYMIFGKEASAMVETYTGTYESILDIDVQMFSELEGKIDDELNGDIKSRWEDAVWEEIV